MLTKLKRVFFRRKVKFEASSLKVAAINKNFDSWQVLDNGQCVFRGTKGQCYQFIDAFREIMKMFA